MEKILRVEGLTKNGILEGISFDVDAGEMIAIMGPSGSGKSTLLYNISGMDRADSGKVWLKDTEIVSMSEEKKADLRLRRMGFVFQQMNVLSNLNILDNIMFPALQALGKKKEGEIKKRALELMEHFGITETKDRMSSEVSGGQLQRACISRSMMLEPEILFADEPTGALNQSAAENVIESFLQINAGGTTILMVTHDGKVASRCDRVLYILDGKLRGQLVLGKFKTQSSKEREGKITAWLDSLGW
ncbi:MAG: ABC transporter ATP-binding protein [Treponema sp.]|nr:ABC transporter ATP-binding protein [Treponema sp.]